MNNLFYSWHQGPGPFQDRREGLEGGPEKATVLNFLSPEIRTKRPPRIGMIGAVGLVLTTTVTSLYWTLIDWTGLDSSVFLLLALLQNSHSSMYIFVYINRIYLYSL